MPASLVSLKLRGIRSYSPAESKLQSLEFLPLTLIVGSNGSGKTSIIEALRFIISGEEPPLSDSRRNFIFSGASNCLAKGASQTKKKKDSGGDGALVELDFTSSRGQRCVARREIAQLGKNLTPSVSSSYKIAESGWKNVHRQEDWNKTIPQLFNLPNQALLNNVVLCHQENNNWCMGDSSTVKQIFDRIFGCEQYKKEIKHVENEIKSCTCDLKVGEKEVERLRDKVERKRFLKNEIVRSQKEMESIDVIVGQQEAEIHALSEQKANITKEIATIDKEVQRFVDLKQKIEDLAAREKSLRDSLRKPLVALKDVPYDELQSKLEHHNKLVHQIRQDQASSMERQSSLKNESSQLEARKTDLQSVITKLQVIDLKSRHTHASIQRALKSLKEEQSLNEIDPGDIPASLKVLEDIENKMKNNKSEQADLEDSLSSKQQKLLKSINSLEGKHQDIFHKIKNKEAFIKKLSDQLAQANPIANELIRVINNLAKMSEVVSTMLHCNQVEILKDLIEESKVIINLLIDKVKNESMVNLSKDIEKEKAEVEINRAKMINLSAEKGMMEGQQAEVENEHCKARASCKEAHNQLIVFVNEKKNIVKIHSDYISERKFLESKSMDAKEQELKQVSEECDRIQRELSHLSLDYKKLSDNLAQSFEQHEEIRNTIQIYDIIKRVDELQIQMNELDENTDREGQLEQLQLKLQKAEAKELELRDERSTLNGTKLQLQREYRKLSSELDSHEKTFTEYSTSMGQVVCNQIIISDLEKLKECLQNSVISFHNQMIVKINEALQSRWRQIYQGSDIEQIELVDEEITRGKDKKAFNYYIAMRKGGTRMKMREKSSAGQRALASIILRMTLAELFVKDFAFIALDEPTANLDLPNVQSLAKAIGTYVKRRSKKGVNIQWIIITHDETFLRALDAECSPFFYKVQLDSEGHSKVVRVSYQDASVMISKESSDGAHRVLLS